MPTIEWKGHDTVTCCIEITKAARKEKHGCNRCGNSWEDHGRMDVEGVSITICPDSLIHMTDSAKFLGLSHNSKWYYTCKRDIEL